MSLQISTVQEYFATLDQRFVSEACKGVEAIFQFQLSGDTGGTWHVSVNDGSFEIAEGAHDKPTTTIKMKEGDYVKMVNGKLNGSMAFMTGKLKVTGSIPMAQRMQKIFPPSA
jgi:putative sterol carrier protein